ncbi:hypothetical protein MBANPS3_012125 [Mucor bainieri]
MNITLGWVNGTFTAIFEIDDNNIGLNKYGADDKHHEEPLMYWIQKITCRVLSTSYARTQVPIVSALASTIRKCQLATINYVDAIYTIRKNACLEEEEENYNRDLSKGNKLEKWD